MFFYWICYDINMEKKENKLLKFIVNNQQWFGFVVLLAVLIYAYTTVIFEPKETVLDIFYGLFFLLMGYGLIRQFIKEKETINKVSFKNLDGLAVIIGVFTTYLLNHFLSIPVVLASAFIGLIGSLLIKKYQVALYCGSFAGMVSLSLFGFFEVSILAIVCAFIFIVTKPLFKGYGGKLGTIAFLSSLIVHSIFNDNFIVLSLDLNIFLILLTTILGVCITYYFKYFLKVSSVLASALPSLLFGLLFSYAFSSHIDYVVVFFSASFIGMSSKERLPNIWYVLLSGVVLGIIYDIFIEFFNGLGGKLGLMAMLSVIITSGLSTVVNKGLKRGVKYE